MLWTAAGLLAVRDPGTTDLCALAFGFLPALAILGMRRAIVTDPAGRILIELEGCYVWLRRAVVQFDEVKDVRRIDSDMCFVPAIEIEIWDRTECRFRFTPRSIAEADDIPARLAAAMRVPARRLMRRKGELRDAT